MLWEVPTDLESQVVVHQGQRELQNGGAAAGAQLCSLREKRPQQVDGIMGDGAEG